MKQEHLGDGAYITIDRDFIGQVIITANHHDPDQATDVVHLESETLVRFLTNDRISKLEAAILIAKGNVTPSVNE